MLRFSVQFTERAADDLDQVPIDIRKEILLDIRQLSSAPFPPGTHVKKLMGFRPLLYRLRTGDYRIIYRVEARAIFVLRVISRKDPDRIIKGVKF